MWGDNIPFGFDRTDNTSNPLYIDKDGYGYFKGMVKDPDTLSWVPATQSVIKTDNLEVHGDMNIAKYGGVAVSVSNPMYVRDSNIDVTLSTRLKPADTLAGVTALGSITSALPTGTNTLGYVGLKDGVGNTIAEQYPLPINSDAVYIGDIDTTYSTSVGWTGDITSPFDSPNSTTEIYNSSGTSPKVLYFAFDRTLYLNAVGIGCNTGKDFSNVKLEFIGSDGTVRYTYDDSSNNTVYGTKLYSFAPTACIGIKMSFYTTATVGISNITIRKETSTVSRLMGLNPLGIVGNVGITYGGSLKSSLVDDLGFSGYNTPNGEIRVIEPIRLAGAGFEGAIIDPNFWTTGATGTAATITQSGGELIFTSGTSSGAYVYGYSVRRSRYVSGSSMRFRSVGKLGDTGTANNKRRWGIGYGASMPTITDGAWFQLDGTEFSVVTCKGGVETKVTAFNGDLDGYSITATNQTCEIYYNNSKVVFCIGGLTLHTVTASLETWTSTTNFHAFADSLNAGVIGASATFNVRTCSIYRLGSFQTAPTSKYQSGTTAGIVCKYNAGVIHNVIISGVTNNAVVTIYDGTSTGGVVLWSSGTMSNQTVPFDIDFMGAPFFTGLFFTITGANCNLFINYE